MDDSIVIRGIGKFSMAISNVKACTPQYFMIDRSDIPI
jgi:hypothetical protein